MRFCCVDKLRETKFSIPTHKSRELGPQTPIGDPPSGEVSVHDPDLAPLLHKFTFVTQRFRSREWLLLELDVSFRSHSSRQRSASHGWTIPTTPPESQSMHRVSSPTFLSAAGKLVVLAYAYVMLCSFPLFYVSQIENIRTMSKNENQSPGAEEKWEEALNDGINLCFSALGMGISCVWCVGQCSYISHSSFTDISMSITLLPLVSVLTLRKIPMHRRLPCLDWSSWPWVLTLCWTPSWSSCTSN